MPVFLSTIGYEADEFWALPQRGIDFAGKQFFSITEAGWILKCETTPTPSMIDIDRLPFDSIM